MRTCLAAVLAVLLTAQTTVTAAAAKTAAVVIPEISARCAVLMDAESGRILYEKAPRERRLIASITKLMTALVAVETAEDLTETVTVKREWTLAEGSSMYLKEREVLTLETLLYGLLLCSGNDAALAVAGSCAEDTAQFVEWMNERAGSLGMGDTHFENPSGLDGQAHYSTAYDMALLAAECLKHPKLAQILSTKSVTREGHTFANHNKLLWMYEGCIGMKTGYTKKAGRTLVSAARRNGQTLICVTLSAPDDWADHKALLDYGFSSYSCRSLACAGESVGSRPVSGSLMRRIGVECAGDVCYPLKEGERVRTVLDLPGELETPLEKGTEVGSLSFWLGEEEIGRTALICSASVQSNLAQPRLSPSRILEYIRSFTVFRPTDAALPRT